MCSHLRFLCRFFFGYVLLLCCLLSSVKLFALPNPDSLRLELRKDIPDTLRIQLWHELGMYLLRRTPDSSFRYADSILYYSERLGYPSGLQQAYHLYGAAAYMSGDYDTAQVAWQNALQLAQAIQDKARVASAYNNLALVLERQSKEDAALRLYQEALAYRKAEKDWKEQAVILNNIGLLYDRQEDYARALSYYRRALHLRDSLGLSKHLSGSYLNTGKMLHRLGELPEAEYHYRKAVRLKKQEHDDWGLGLAYAYLGDILQETQRPDSVFWYYEKAQAIADAQEAGWLQLEILLGKMQTYLERSAVDQVLNQKAYALQLAASVDDLYQTTRLHHVLFRAYQQKEDFKQAYQHHVQYKQLSDSVFSKQKNFKLGQLEAQHNWDSQQRQSLEEQAKRAYVFQQKITAQERNQYILAGIILMVLLTALVMYRGYRMVVTRNALLRARDAEITTLNQQLEQQVQERIAKLEKYAYMNAHNVRGPLARIQGLTDLFAIPGALNEEEKKEMARRVYEAAEELDQVIREINDQLSR